MSIETAVWLREEQVNRPVAIGNNLNKKMEERLREKWQGIISLVANIMNVPSALIMQITQSSMEVYLKSENPENPYKEGGSDSLGHGLYCETVIGKDKELLVENALENKAWKDNPDVKLGMISYFGLPIRWPNNSFFGTICVLDNKSNAYNEHFIELLRVLRNSIEEDLMLISHEEKLRFYAEMDSLTSIYNRRKIESLLNQEIDRSKRSGSPFSVALMDLNKFKSINDTHGHETGDRILQAFAKSMSENIRTTDFIGRWGGDEFLLICPFTDKRGTEILFENLQEKVQEAMNRVIPNQGFCFGLSTWQGNEDAAELLLQADQELYRKKNS